jgi:hypothetical protein
MLDISRKYINATVTLKREKSTLLFSPDKT